MLHFTHPVTIVRPSGADEYGNPGTSFVAPVLESALALRGGEDLVFLAPGAVISDVDRLIIDGLTYSITCKPLHGPQAVRAIEVRLAAL